MSERSEDIGRLAAREQEKAEDTGQTTNTEEEATEGSSQGAEANNGSSPSAESDAGESAPDHPLKVKDREETAFMYLPESLANDVDLACQSVNITYQSESGEKLGKNRYLYPIVLLVGADNAVDLSYEEIQALVERVDEVEDAI